MGAGVAEGDSRYPSVCMIYMCVYDICVCERETERKSGNIQSRIQARRFNGMTWKFRDGFPRPR